MYFNLMFGVKGVNGVKGVKDKCLVANGKFAVPRFHVYAYADNGKTFVLNSFDSINIFNSR